MASASGGDGETVDFDLHSLVGIRLLGASRADAAAVARQLGPIRKPLTREPDITIRFVDRLASSGRLTYLGRDDAGFTDDAFLVLRSKHKSRARVQIPLEQVGGHCEIVCERGVAAVPLLIPILNATVLAGGSLPLHAAAFRHRGLGIVATGWSKGGKTEAMLAFGMHGAEYVGDEWVYIDPAGRHVFGIPEPIRLWNWHIEQLPAVRRGLGIRNRFRLAMLSGLEGLDDLGAHRRRELPGARVLRRVMPIVEQQLHVDVPPEQIFGDRVGSMSAPFERLFLMSSTDDSEVRVVPIRPQEVARRMAHSLHYERLDLVAAYLKFRYAFPDLRNRVIEEAPEMQERLLLRVTAGKPAYRVDHPYPVRFEDLFRALEPYCTPVPEQTSSEGP